MDLEQLRALLVIVDEGSFEAAAHALGISPSAVSQRIRALERAVGRPVVRRGAPCVPTDALGTWSGPVLEIAATWDDTVLDLHVEDQDHSARLLRQGEVLAAVTADPQPVQGCAVEPLGSMRYIPLAAPALLARHTAAGALALAALPMMRFNAKDDLLRRALDEAGLDVSPPTHLAPSFDAVHGCVRVPGLDDVVVPLHGQADTLPSPRLQRLTRAVRHIAAQALEVDDVGGLARTPSAP